MASIKYTINGYEARTLLKKEQVKIAAKTILQTNKQGDLNMDSLAELSGVAKMSIYKYFDSKVGLLSEIILEILQRENQKIVDIFNSDLSFNEKLSQHLFIKYKFIQLGYMPVLNMVIAENGEAKNKLELYQADAVNLINQLIDQGINENQIDKTIPKQVIFHWIQMILFAFEKDMPLTKRIENDVGFFNDFVMVFWRGLKP